MKLRTEIKKWSDGEFYPSVGDDRDVFARLEHDAAAAHALMQAVGEFHNAPLDSSLTFPKEAIDWLEGRADEIMREWGFDSGEVE